MEHFTPILVLPLACLEPVEGMGMKGIPPTLIFPHKGGGDKSRGGGDKSLPPRRGKARMGVKRPGAYYG
jgi:hypothetical protein